MWTLFRNERTTWPTSCVNGLHDFMKIARDGKPIVKHLPLICNPKWSGLPNLLLWPLRSLWPLDLRVKNHFHQFVEFVICDYYYFITILIVYITKYPTLFYRMNPVRQASEFPLSQSPGPLLSSWAFAGPSSWRQHGSLTHRAPCACTSEVFHSGSLGVKSVQYSFYKSSQGDLTVASSW